MSKAPALALTLIGLLLLSTAAFATPSTLVWIPSTDIQADQTWHLGVDTYFAFDQDHSAIVDVGLTYGFGDGRAEAGFDLLSNLDDPLFFNAKYQLLPESDKVPTLVAGLYNFGTKSDETDYNMAYALASKTFGPARWTLGYCHGKRGTLGPDNDMILAGVDGYLSKNQKWWGAIDYQGGDSVFGALSFGVSYCFTDKISLLIGYDLYNNEALNAHDTFTIQLDTNF